MLEFQIFKNGKLIATYDKFTEASAYRVENGKCRIHEIERCDSNEEHIFAEYDVYSEWDSVELNFSQFIIKYLKVTGRTMKSLAEEIEVPYRTLQDWKNGLRVPPKFIQKALCDKFSEVLTDYCLYER